jgi:hypothetical protein
VAFKEAKIRIPPADKMDLPEFLEAMGKLAAYKRGGWTFKGPILYSKLSSSITQVTIERVQIHVYPHLSFEYDNKFSKTKNNGTLTPTEIHSNMCQM